MIAAAKELSGARRDFPNKKLQKIMPSAEATRKYETKEYPWLEASQKWRNSRSTNASYWKVG